MTMRRRRILDDIDNPDLPAPRSRGRSLRVLADDDAALDEPAAESVGGTTPLGESLLALCSRFGLESWAASDDGHGLRAFGEALSEWLEQPQSERPVGPEFQLEAIRLLTNLLVIVGAAIRPGTGDETSACRRSLDIVLAARRSIASLVGPVASSPGSARAMERLVRVRGWNRLAAAQQTLAESLLDLYLETLAAMLVAGSEGNTANVLLTTADAWLTMLNLQALPSGFDERLLRATSWYLESYSSSQHSR